MLGGVSISGDAYVPFEPRTRAARDLREMIREELRGLSHVAEEEILLAAFGGTLPAGADVENALFYNIGAGVFGAVTKRGLAFELEPAPPAGVQYTYELGPVDAWPRFWTRGTEFARVESELGEQALDLAHVWWALRSSPGCIEVGALRRQPDEVFAIDLEVAGPVRCVGPEIVKKLLDGVICGLQSEADLEHAHVMAPRLAAGLARPVDDVLRALTDGGGSALGPKPGLIHRHGDGLKWSPDDDRCVAARIVLTPAPEWSLKGSACALSPRLFRVLVDDNFHFDRADERWVAGEYAAYASAVERCRDIVDACLQEAFEPGMNAEQLLATYKHYGEDPWVSETPFGSVRFSGWDYAAERSRELCG